MQEFGNPFSQKSLLLSCYPHQGNVREMDIKVINIKVTLDAEWLSRHFWLLCNLMKVLHHYSAAHSPRIHRPVPCS